MKQNKKYLLIILLIIIVIIALALLVSAFHKQSLTQKNPKITCTHKWKCNWGPCVNGSQSQELVDTNNCNAIITGQIVCPKLARKCNGALGE